VNIVVHGLCGILSVTRIFPEWKTNVPEKKYSRSAEILLQASDEILRGCPNAGSYFNG
jgi:hypothetical protein